ncbi:hypothetical protein CVT24_007189, partial [Panaeolus cyanescens]
VPYRRGWRTAFSDAFDLYLTLKRHVNGQVQKALGRDSEHWRAKNACPPCNYELENEKPLKYRILMALDGNDSTKRVDVAGFRQQGDTRTFESDYFIPQEEVDTWNLANFKGRGPEVPQDPDRDTNIHQTVPDNDNDSWDTDSDDEHVSHDVDASPLGGKSTTDSCVKNWKAARDDAKKRVLGMFDETGWFASGCRHGLILWVADMVRSGEMAKYPLSIINRVLEHLGTQFMVGYDIGCSFQKTIQSTPLGKSFADSGSRCCVNAYHGYAHNFACQCANHPNNLEGLGLEDLETMERLFSLSNAVAIVIRYASKYRRRLFLDLFMRQYDMDKYANLGLMLRNNYVQALKIKLESTVVLDKIYEQRRILPGDLDKWHHDQATYFASLGKEPDADIHRVAYVELLQELRDANDRASSLTDQFLNMRPDDYDIQQGGLTYDGDLSQTRRVETQRKAARDKVNHITQELVEMEAALGIEKRWDPTMPQYIETLQYMSRRKYQKALDHLQKLVVQRLFELHRLNISGVGYRARSLLAKAMRTRSRAIQNAITKYNVAARQLDPPMPALDWSKISKYNFVEEFSLLADGRKDVRKDPWSDPEIREAMKLNQRLKRADEEIDRLNIEVARLYTSILDEHDLFDRVRKQLETEKQYHLLGAVNATTQHRERINHAIIQFLREIVSLEGYTGPKELRGKRVGSSNIPASDNVSTASLPADPSDANDGNGEQDEDDDEEAGQIGGVLDFLADLSTQ